jgi:Ssp1 endopeptidase immunity protein Rap1a
MRDVIGVARQPIERVIRMKHLSALCLFISCFAIVVAHAEDEDGNFLLRECKETQSDTYQGCEPAIRSMHCLGYIDGLVDMNDIYKSNILKSSSQALICLPKEKRVTVGDLARVVVKYLEDNPGQLHESAAALATVALGKAFPCKAKAASP